MPTTKNGITVHEDIKDTCLGCHSEMTYHTADETCDGKTIKVHLRYCPDCHANTISELESQRRAKKIMEKFDESIATLKRNVRAGVML